MQPQGVQIFNPIILAMAFPHTVPLKGTDPILTVMNTQFPFTDGILFQKFLRS